MKNWIWYLETVYAEDLLSCFFIGFLVASLPYQNERSPANHLFVTFLFDRSLLETSNFAFMFAAFFMLLSSHLLFFSLVCTLLSCLLCYFCLRRSCFFNIICLRINRNQIIFFHFIYQILFRCS